MPITGIITMDQPQNIVDNGHARALLSAVRSNPSTGISDQDKGQQSGQQCPFCIYGVNMKTKAPTLAEWRDAKKKTAAEYQLLPLKLAITRSLTYKRIGLGQIELSAELFKRQLVDNPALAYLMNLPPHTQNSEIGASLREVMKTLITALYPLRDIGIAARNGTTVKKLEL